MMMIEVHSPSSSTPSLETGSSPQSLEQKLRRTLQEETEFEMLMDWMFREFSSEVLLSVIELVQFQSFLKEYGQTATTVLSPSERIVFYGRIPSSSIVHQEESLDKKEVKVVNSSSEDSEDKRRKLRLKRIASTLHEKYIRRHCELEINISCSLRDRWGMLHSNNYPSDQLTELNTVVNCIIQEMMKYLRQSYIRFDIDRK